MGTDSAVKERAIEMGSGRHGLLFDSAKVRGLLYGLRGFYRGVGPVEPVTEKATGKEIHITGVAASADVELAASVGRQVQRNWAKTPGTERGDILRRFATLLGVHRDEVMSWLMRETGSITGKGAFEVDLSIRETLEASTLATRAEGSIISDDGNRQSVILRVPLGVVGIITPWNSPLILAVRSVIPALALGNAVLLKPDVQTPVCGGFLIAQLLEEAGLPEGLLHVLPGGSETGKAVVAEPNVAMISFTGSTEVGRRVGSVAGGLLKRCALELGGNNAYIVADDADIKRAAMAGSFGSFFHQGQICFTIGRHLVHRSVVDAYTAALIERAKSIKVGDPCREDVQMGPMVNERQAQRAEKILADSVAMGARVLTGGHRSGLFFEPTVVVDVTPEMPLFHQEIFGPIAPILPVDSDAEAVALANKTEYGLVAAIHTTSSRRARLIAGQLSTGIIHVNDQPIVHEVYGPIGGMGASGNGSRSGLPGWVHEFSQLQWRTYSERAPEYPF